MRINPREWAGKFLAAVRCRLFDLACRFWSLVRTSFIEHPKIWIFNSFFILVCLLILVLALHQDDRQIYYAVEEEDEFVVVLDIGHGGQDPGAVVENVLLPDGERVSLFEHGLVFDIGARLMRLLNAHDNVAVLPLVTDEHGNLSESSLLVPLPPARSFLQSRPWCNLRETSTTVAVNLRWMLANFIEREEEQREGGDERRMVFISLHMDEVSHRSGGLTVYTPAGATVRLDPKNEEKYLPFYEAREWLRRPAKNPTTNWDVIRSNQLARLIVERFRRLDLAVCHEQIYNIQVQRHDRSSYEPAGLPSTEIDTRVLLELANLADRDDQLRVMNPEYREQIAWAIYDSVMAVFRNGSTRSSSSLLQTVRDR